jgi:hypothetical protein
MAPNDLQAPASSSSSSSSSSSFRDDPTHHSQIPFHNK